MTAATVTRAITLPLLGVALFAGGFSAGRLTGPEPAAATAPVSDNRRTLCDDALARRRQAEQSLGAAPSAPGATYNASWSTALAAAYSAATNAQKAAVADIARYC